MLIIGGVLPPEAVDVVDHLYGILDYHGYNTYVVGFLALYLQKWIPDDSGFRIGFLELYLDTDRVPVLDYDLIRDLEDHGFNTYTNDHGVFWVRFVTFRLPIYIRYPFNNQYIPSIFLKVRNVEFIHGMKVVEAHIAFILMLLSNYYSVVELANIVRSGRGIDHGVFRGVLRHVRYVLTHRSDLKPLVRDLNRRIDIFMKRYTADRSG